ncbi:DUF3320 domain-containing protein [Pseudoalteromonas luteoviolacea]|uniref:DUF3320 domain-containing protein n=1 Tax=Pseudoalteromonas luteoviolacea (strain 2ta16) TaxID=1353533 RepID=V4HV20_PSEL2|nr:DUF3320 domain-containing protein [Pseudoalteromonas luteoviolacea]ESP94675.1 protein of unknown function (DUF3320) [Pseudoalteromonas luteoviolacea 2ta16]KZN43462.1 RNA helicase [Pseudoalteromonas luteoviolacea NCIMB 1944]
MTVEQKLESARLELLDMGLRANPQLNYRSNSKAIDIIDEKSEQIFELLVEKEKTMSFLPLPKAYQKNISDDDKSTFFQSDDDTELPPLDLYLEQQKGESRFNDKYLQTGFMPAKLDKALLKLEADAHTMLQEQGIEVMYLALGFLQWNEPSNTRVSRYAPLILVPVKLTRSSARDSFKLKYTGEELGSNLTLAAKLRTEFNLKLPSYANEDTLEAYYQAVADAVAKQLSWRVHPDKIGLGLFSFGKFQMYMDLDQISWPEGKKPTQQSLINRLLSSGFDSEIVFNESELKHPERLHLVKDADSSQISAILAMKSSSDFIIQGPPGTGKSQTITNIIAEAVALGKKVLFVAQKMAALEVVKTRLDEAHLGFAVLELHSHKSTKKAVLTSISKSLQQGKPQIVDRDRELTELTTTKSLLDSYAKEVRIPILKSKINYIGALGKLMQLEEKQTGTPIPLIPFSVFSNWTDETYSNVLKIVDELTLQLKQLGEPANHPFSMSTRKDFSPALHQELSEVILALQGEVSRLASQGQKVADSLQVDIPICLKTISNLIYTANWLSDVPDLQGVKVDNTVWVSDEQKITRGLEIMDRTISLKKKVEAEFILAVFDADLLSIREGLVGKTDKWWRIFSPSYRKSKNKLFGLWKGALPSDPAKWLIALDTALEYRSVKCEFDNYATIFSKAFGALWQSEHSEKAELHGVFEWIKSFYQKVKSGQLQLRLAKVIDAGVDKQLLLSDLEVLNKLHGESLRLSERIVEIVGIDVQIGGYQLSAMKFSDLHNLLSSWGKPEKLYEFARYNQIIEELEQKEAQPLIKLAYNWKESPESLRYIFEKSYYQGLVDYAYTNSISIRQFDRVKHERTIENFKQVDEGCLFYAQEKLANQLFEQLPNKNSKGEMELVLRELSKKTRHIPLRRLLSEAGNIIQKIKPIFMMSPMSIATYLKQGALEFDLVIFDEASQIPAPDALGAMMRGNQVIVVGDSKQMPPNNLFGKSVELDDEELEKSDTAEIESILALMESKGAPSHMLKWHYRSRHDSLIAVSNEQFYKNELIAFPSPGGHRDATGLKFHYLPDTWYDKGGSRTNTGEVNAIVVAVLKHAMTKPHLSLGIVAFSLSQRDAIILELEKARRLHPETDSFFDRHKTGDEFFVKNLENVQGDERDVIFISICYGKTNSGQISQNFGLLNKPGGERRLNVLISRARLSMEVFANFHGNELKVDDKSPFGLRSLQAFLEFAECNVVQTNVGGEQGLNFAFGQVVQEAIQSIGYQVATRIGNQGYFIDLAIRHPSHPEQFVLALQYDGAGYFEAVSARDRERLRQSVLEGLGWKFERIWSTDWYRDPKSELQRLKVVIDEAILSHDANMAIIESDTTQKFELESASSTSIDPEYQGAPSVLQRAEVEQEPKFDACNTPYKKVDSSELNMPKVDDFSAVPLSVLEHAIERVVASEYPIFSSIVASRLANAAGLSRVGSKIKRIVEQTINGLNNKNIIQKGDKGVLWPNGVSTVKLRNWDATDASMKKLENVSDEELTNALLLTVRDAHAINISDSASAALGLLGFQRATAQAVERVNRLAIEQCKKGVLISENDRLKIAVRS